MSRKKAVIDLGTNSVLYLLTDCDKTGVVQTLTQDTHAVRLGENLQQTGLIQKDRLDKVIKILKYYTSETYPYDADSITVIGTQVFRSAENSKECCRTIFEQTGLDVEILSEEDESKWGYIGAMYDRAFDDLVCTCDIGGGSCEIVLGKNKKIRKWTSVPLGAITLTEKYVHHDPPILSEYRKIEEAIGLMIAHSAQEFLKKGRRLVVSGGTGTTLTAYDLRLETYDSKRVDGYCLTRQKIKDFAHRFMKFSLEEKQRMLILDRERADIIFAGTVLLDNIMKLGSFDSFMVSDRGVRFGVAVREWGKTINRRRLT